MDTECVALLFWSEMTSISFKGAGKLGALARLAWYVPILLHGLQVHAPTPKI